MMSYLFYMFVGFFFVVVQTSVLPIFPIFENFYDLQIVLIIYLGFFCSFTKTFPFVFLWGFLMDSISGGPFGLYLTVYVWLFAGTNLLSNFFHYEGIVSLVIVMVFGIVFQNIVVLFSIAMMDKELSIFFESWFIVLTQLGWIVCTGPFLFRQIVSANKVWEYSYKKTVTYMKEDRG